MTVFHNTKPVETQETGSLAASRLAVLNVRSELKILAPGSDDNADLFPLRCVFLAVVSLVAVSGAALTSRRHRSEVVHLASSSSSSSLHKTCAQEISQAVKKKDNGGRQEKNSATYGAAVPRRAGVHVGCRVGGSVQSS